MKKKILNGEVCSRVEFKGGYPQVSVQHRATNNVHATAALVDAGFAHPCGFGQERRGEEAPLLSCIYYNIQLMNGTQLILPFWWEISLQHSICKFVSFIPQYYLVFEKSFFKKRRNKIYSFHTLHLHCENSVASNFACLILCAMVFTHNTIMNTNWK